MRRSFKPSPADQIEDEDERCRVKHETFVAKQKSVNLRPLWKVLGQIVAGLAITVAIVGTGIVIFTHPVTH